MHRHMANALFMRSLFFSLSFDVPDDRIFRRYISKSGSDVHPGTMKAPLASFEAAQQRVRTIRKSFPDVSVEVVVRGGVYFLEQTIEFTAEDSGTPTAPVVWKAADGEKVILSVGRRIKGLWRKDKNGIWFADVPEAKGWKQEVSVPEHYHQKQGPPWNFRELYVNGKRATRARYPNESATNPFMYAVASAVDKVHLPAGSVKASWADEADAQINLVPRWRFFNQWNDVVICDAGDMEIKPIMGTGTWSLKIAWLPRPGSSRLCRWRSASRVRRPIS